MTAYKPINTLDKKPWEYFLIRPKGLHKGTGEKFLPTAVTRLEDGQYYSAEDHIEPKYFGQDEDHSHPLFAELEWCELPE